MELDNSTDKGNRLLTKRDLAKHLSLSVRGVERLMARRTIPYFVLGHRTVRFDPTRVKAALAKLEVRAR